MRADPSRSGGPRRVVGAACGLVAAFAGLAVAELVTAAVRPEASPVAAVGAAAVDLTPQAVREWAIGLFGTADKAVLAVGIVVVLAAVAAGAGLLAVRRPPAGVAVAGGFGLLGAAAALSRPAGSWQDALPSLAGGLTAAGVLALLATAAARPRP
ncbi:molybdopterin-binding oxidoreductase, partial [Streptomyces sp. NPDC054987]